MIFEDRSEKQCNSGFDRGRAITEVWQKGRPVTKIWLLSNLRFGPIHRLAVLGSGHRNPVLHPSPPHTTMNSSSTEPEPEPSHGDLLADRLRRLDIPDDHPVQAPSDDHPPPFLPNAPYDGYAFRPSGRTSPRAPTDRNSPLPDVNGLGWPGILFSFLSHPRFCSITTRRPSPPSSNHKQSRPCLALMHRPLKMRPAKRDSPPRCAPSSSVSARTPIEKAFFAHQNDTPRP
jgi:hypothetical protein